MSSHLAVAPLSAIRTVAPAINAGAADVTTPARPAPAQSRSAQAGSATIGAPASQRLANPRTVVDPGLDRVVLEFFNSGGALTNSIPSQRQLDAYRIAALAGKQAQDSGSVAA